MDPAAQPFLEASYVRHVGGCGGIEVTAWFCLCLKDTHVNVELSSGGLFLEPSDNQGSI